MSLEIIGRIGAKFYAMAVDSQGRAQVSASSESEDRHINQLSGKVWSINYEALTVNAGVDAIYIKNTGTKHLHLTDHRNHARDAATEIHIHHVTGTAGGGTPVSTSEIQSRNVGTSVSPTATIEVATAATGLTGLNDEGDVFIYGSLDNKSSHLSTTSNVIIGPGSAMIVKFVTANATNGVAGSLSVVEVDHET